MFNILTNHPIMTAIGVIAFIFLFGWASNGGLEIFHADLINGVGEVAGVNATAEKIRNPFD